MLLVELAPLVAQLNPYCRQALENAAAFCMSRGHYEVTIEHVFIKLMETPQTDLPLLLHRRDADQFKRDLDRALDALRSGNSGSPVFSPLLLALLQDAWLIASINLGEKQIRSAAMLLAYLARNTYSHPTRTTHATHATPAFLDRATLLAAFAHARAASNETARETSNESLNEEATPAPERGALGRFCEDVTQKARDGKIDPIFGRDVAIRQMIDILARRRKNNPICVGEPGVGKTALVEGLALKIASGDVPDCLKNATLLALDMGLLQAGAGIKGEFENRLKALVTQIKAATSPIVLFIDEAHMLIGSGAAAGSSDAANLLKPALARGELRAIAATTWAEYKKYFEKDAALARRFQPVKLDEPDQETAVTILRGVKEKYEVEHNVLVRDDAIVAAVTLSSRYISGRQLPDKAVDLLDTACARIKVRQSIKPEILENAEREIDALLREQHDLTRGLDHHWPVDHARLTRIDSAIAALAEQIKIIEPRWRAQQAAAASLLAARAAYARAHTARAPSDELDSLATRRAAAEHQWQQVQIKPGAQDKQSDEPLVRIDVDPEAIAQVVSDWTGIPTGRMFNDRAQILMQMPAVLRASIHGQDAALQHIAQCLQNAAAGLNAPHQPLGVFLLVGPSGVGKTETARAVAELLFGSPNAAIVINMSEFQEHHSTSRLIGSPPGYVGYGEGGLLTEAVRQRPYSVVMLEEVEKAHPDVMNVFYQVFDKGVLVDGEGQSIDFSNTVIFLTSNLGAEVMTEVIGQDPTEVNEAVLLARLHPVLAKHFKPALLARMTIVPYRALTTDALITVVRMKLDKLAERIASHQKATLIYCDQTVQRIAQCCTQVESGARNIDFILAKHVMPEITQRVLSALSSGEALGDLRLSLDAAGNFAIVATAKAMS